MTYFRASFSSINGDDIEEKSEKDTKEVFWPWLFLERIMLHVIPPMKVVIYRGRKISYPQKCYQYYFLKIYKLS